MTGKDQSQEWFAWFSKEWDAARAMIVGPRRWELMQKAESERNRLRSERRETILNRFEFRS